VKRRIAVQRQRDGISNNEPWHELIDVAGGYERIDLVLNESRDIAAMLGDQLPRNDKYSDFVDCFPIALIPFINFRFHRPVFSQEQCSTRPLLHVASYTRASSPKKRRCGWRAVNIVDDKRTPVDRTGAGLSRNELLCECRGPLTRYAIPQTDRTSHECRAPRRPRQVMP